jgi:hypothetical protein
VPARLHNPSSVHAASTACSEPAALKHWLQRNQSFTNSSRKYKRELHSSIATLTPKPEKISQETKITEQWINLNILNKILADWILPPVERILQHDPSGI